MSILSKALSKIATAWLESQSTDDVDVDERGQVPQSAFERAVVDAASSIYRVHSAHLVGPSRVAVTFYSESRKQRWDAYLDFDLNAETFSCSGTPYGSGMPRVFGDAVIRELRGGWR